MLSVKTFKNFDFAIRQMTFFFSYFYIKHLKYLRTLTLTINYKSKLFKCTNSRVFSFEPTANSSMTYLKNIYLTIFNSNNCQINFSSPIKSSQLILSQLLSIHNVYIY